jgi:hypothetical protein
MELSERPPQPRPPNVIPPNAYPHIIIGGKPFYLIPSSGEGLNNEGMFESYSYPQHVPIYEEIDGGSRFYEAASEMDFRCRCHKTPLFFVADGWVKGENKLECSSPSLLGFCVRPGECSLKTLRTL